MYLTSISGDRTNIKDPTDPTSAGVTCGTMINNGLNDEVQGAVRYFPGGYSESATYAQDAKTYPLQLKHLSSADAYKIYQWRGTVLLFRFKDGTHFFGVYFTTSRQRFLNTTPDVDDGLGVTWDIDITVTEVSFDETLIIS